MSSRDRYRPAPAAQPRSRGRVSRRQLLGLSRTKLGHAPVDLDALAQRRAAEWDRESRVAMLRALEPVAEVLAAVAEVGPATRGLDVGAGDGNVALACTARGARMDACDLSAAMVRRGRARCADVVAWRAADAQRLPYPRDRFDVVVSGFGAACAPDPLRVAAQLARVCRPGGRVVVAAWVPRGLPGRMPELVDAVDPPPEGVPAPGSWGHRDRMQARLAPHLDELTVRTYVVSLRFESAERCFDAMAPSTLDEAGRAALRPPFERLLGSVNNRPPAVELDARYLVATGIARA